MSFHNLTKSAFKIGRSCPTKLFYYRSGYPSRLSENQYLQFLADGGHMVGKLAQLLYPEGVLIESTDGLDLAVSRTEEELKRPNVVLFEAALKAGNKLVLVDVLEKRGKSIKLIEVKSKGFDSDQDRKFKDEGKRTFFVNSKGTIDADWQEYLEDICYQELVAKLSHPEFEFIPYLLLPDKARCTTINNLASRFKIVEQLTEDSRRKTLKVEYKGDPAEVIADRLLVQVNVEREVALLREEVIAHSKMLEKSLNPLTKIATPISVHCSDCEYRSGEQKNGFLECWGKLGEVTPHIFELYYGTAIEKGELFNSLIQQKKASLFDVQFGDLTGKRGVRQEIQITYTKSQCEWISGKLRDVIESVQYPLHFIDFETSRIALPYHHGMRPYEQVAFQWSCHSIEAPEEEPKHTEWINTDDTFPNFEFASSLKSQIGTKGTVLTWAHHESSVLSDILTQMRKYGREDADLEKWLDLICDKSSNRILDLNKVALENYFHPEMKGKTSLKYVLPAVWNGNKQLHEIPWLHKYVSYDADQQTIDPYKVLAQIEIAGEAEVVNEGTGAMRAYQDMMYGLTANDSALRTKWKKLLLQYCELDTMAMVIVWTHWNNRVADKFE